MPVFCLLLKISLEVLCLLEVIVSLVRVSCSDGNTYIKGASIESAYIASNCVGRACTGDTCTDSPYAKNACTKVISDKSVCIGNTTTGIA